MAEPADVRRPSSTEGEGTVAPEFGVQPGWRGATANLRWTTLSTFRLLLVRDSLIALVLAGVLAWLYSSIIGDLVRQWWEDDNYSHGFLVPLFSAALIWRRRDSFRGMTLDGSWLGLPVLLAGILALLLGELGAESFAMRSSLIVVLAGLVLFHLGSEALRLLALPLAFLFFAVPVPATLFYAVAFPLQNLAARNAASVLDLLGVPVLIDGNVIHLSQISLGVTEACSGIRSLISLLCAAVALATVIAARPWAKWTLVAAAIPITVVANVGRVVATGLIGQWVGVDYARGFFHTFSGWLIFVSPSGSVGRPEPRPRSPADAPGAASLMRPLRAGLSIALLLGASIVLQFRSSGEAVPVRKPLDHLPAGWVAGWQSRAERSSRWTS